MGERAWIDPEELHRRAQVAALVGVLRGDEPAALVDAVERHHVPGRFSPDIAMLELAADALALACPPGSPPLEYEGVRERYLPQVVFRGRTEHRNSQYALYAAACMRAGLQPDLFHDTSWWQAPLWTYATYAFLIYSRAAADRLHVAPAEIARRMAEGRGLSLGEGADAAGRRNGRD